MLNLRVGAAANWKITVYIYIYVCIYIYCNGVTILHTDGPAGHEFPWRQSRMHCNSATPGPQERVTISTMMTIQEYWI